MFVFWLLWVWWWLPWCCSSGSSSSSSPSTPDFARANGFHGALWSALLSVLVVAAIVMGLQLAGVVLMVGMLIAPGVAARQWSDRLGGMVLLAAVFGAGSGAAGAILSAVDADLPTGPMIIVTAFSVVVASVFFAPRRGVVWTVLRRRGDARRFALRTTLRDVYHYAYDHGGPAGGVPEAFLIGLRGTSGRRSLRRLLAQGFMRKIEDSESGVRWFLTASGREVARDDARNQHLWDLYRSLATQLGLPVVVEERERDIRAVLPPAAVQDLERYLTPREGEPRVRD